MNTSTTKQHLSIDGATIAVHEQGQGMPILFLHGSPDTHDMWLPVMDRLQDEARCMAIDLPGFGDSMLPADFSLSLDHMADFIGAVLDGLDISEPVTLVTTDFGGHYGMAFTTLYPDRVRGIAISATNFFADYQWHFFAKLYRVPLLGELMLATSTKGMLSRTLRQVSPALPEAYIDSSYDKGFGSPKVRKTILRMYRERDPKDFIGWEERLLKVLADKPALVLWGDKDPFIKPSYAERFGTTNVHHFPTYSHWLPLEAPDEYVEVLRPWLRGL